MDRRIVLVRHVSSPRPPGVRDFDRPIDDSGREDAEAMAEHLLENDWLPRRVLCSRARRAKETWEAMEAVLDGDFDVTYTEKLYGADTETICEQIWGLPDDVAEVLLVGHNPGWSDAASWLSNVRTRMPKGSAALLETSGDSWSEAAQRGSCRLVGLVRPSEL